MRPTLKDIAKKADLSIKHVSRVLRNEPGISPETRKKVREIARQLGYRPNLTARSLVLKRSYSIGVLAPDFQVPFFAELISSLQGQLQSSGYFPYLLHTDWKESQANQLVELLLAKGIDGLITVGVLSSETKQLLKQHHVPLVYVAMGPPEEISEINIVAYDDVAGGQMAARYLLGIGHRRIAYYDVKGEKRHHSSRLDYFVEALRSNPKASVEIYFSAKDLSSGEGYHGCGAIVKKIKQGEIDAVFCHCDSLAIGLMCRLHEEGVRVPEQVSVMGYDDLEVSRFLVPSLTTIAQPASNLGPHAGDLIVRLIESPTEDTRHHVILKPALVERKSTARKKA